MTPDVMDLILWRHAEAVDLREGRDDLDRALTGKGERQALRVAGWLSRQLPAGARILASPARRTQQTAAALGREFRTEPALAPGCSVESLLATTRWPHEHKPTLIVGHQPTLGMTVSYLLSGQPSAWPLRKGALVWLRVRRRDDGQQVLLHAAVSPELL